MTTHTILQPAGWAKPKGYANGVAAQGRFVFVGGQIGWNGQSRFETDDLVGQVRQTLRNVVDVLAEAGAKPEHVTTMTWYLTNKKDYLGNLEGIGKAYREVMGRNFPAMAVVEVTAWSRTAPRSRSRPWRSFRPDLPRVPDTGTASALSE